MKIINALACAGFYRLPDGEWRRHSRFTQAINFCRPDGELLTLLRHGKGMGPTGILLSTTQFPHVEQIEWLIKQGNTLRGQNIEICPRRILQFPMNSIAIVPVDLSLCAHDSGLCGALNQPLHTMLHYSEVVKQLDCWYCGMTPDWSWLIGCGPGLTPSGDDMLTGMLAVLYAAGFSEQLQFFLPPAVQLAKLTTSVSCSYLNSARVGEFSTSVQKVIRGLQPGRESYFAIAHLLAVGHTSGADILLGIAIAQQWLQRTDPRRMHARSGNNTHFYLGCRDGEFFPRGQLAS
ncbi:TPA: DUF2877 domain-containing protein [Citrobacter freundii]|nr:DUF2877 domain-containing protein [Citrobacter freundii]